MFKRFLSMSAEEEDEEEKIAPMVRYLQKLGAEQVEVILAASRWVFEQDKEAGLQVRHNHRSIS